MEETRRIRAMAGCRHTVIVLAVLVTLATLSGPSASRAEGGKQPFVPRAEALHGPAREFKVGSTTGTTPSLSKSAVIGSEPVHLFGPRKHVRILAVDERVEAQRTIEEVNWRHRIWPKENQPVKPAHSTVLPDAAIRAKVDDYLKKSDALERFRYRPVTGRQLQPEMDRIARSTRDAEMLRERG